jgi:hypothetical protein
VRATRAFQAIDHSTQASARQTVDGE